MILSSAVLKCKGCAAASLLHIWLQQLGCISAPCLQHCTTPTTASTDVPKREKMNPNHPPEHKVAADACKCLCQGSTVQPQTAAANARFCRCKMQHTRHGSKRGHHQGPVSQPPCDGKTQHSTTAATTEELQPTELGCCVGFPAAASPLLGFGHDSALATDSKVKAGGEGWLQGSGQG